MTGQFKNPIKKTPGVLGSTVKLPFFIYIDSYSSFILRFKQVFSLPVNIVQFPRDFKDLERTFQKYPLLLLIKKRKQLGQDLTFCPIYILIILTVKTHMKL